MDPINYTIQTANPFESVLKGYQGGLGIQQAEAARQIQQQQMQAAQAKQQQNWAVIGSLINNPNAGAKAYEDATLLVPEMREQFKQAWEMRNKDQQKTQIANLSQWGAAIQNGQPQYAIDGMNAEADAIENTAGAPTKESQALRHQAQVVKENPAFGGFIIKSLLAAHPEGKSVVDALASQGAEQRAQQLQPGLVDKGIADASTAQSDAVKAAAAAEVAQNTVAPLTAKPALDNQIAELNAQINAADSETKRGQLTLERDKLVQQKAEKAVTNGQEKQTQLDSLNQSVETAQKLLADPLLESPIGIGSAIGKLLSYIPGTDNKDYRANIATLKSQIFIPAVAALKAAGGAGALSDAEGKKLDAAVASLDPDMSAPAFKNNLGVVLRYLKKGQERVLADSKLPQTGGAFVLKHPTFGSVREGDINKLLVKFPGATRDQVIEYLNSTGAQ